MVETSGTLSPGSRSCHAIDDVTVSATESRCEASGVDVRRASVRHRREQ